MLANVVRVATVLTLVITLCGWVEGQDEKKLSGSVVGQVKGMKNVNDGKNTVIDVLAPGEEKARSYHVIYDLKAKGPIPSVLAAVRAAKVGDVVEIEWVSTNHGPAIKAFQQFKKKSDDKK